MRETFDLDSLPEDRKRTSPDGRWVLGWWIADHHEDIFDEDTFYEVVLWDLASRVRAATYPRSFTVTRRAEGTTQQGCPIVSVGFGERGDSLFIRYADGTEELHPVPPRPPSGLGAPGEPRPIVVLPPDPERSTRPRRG